MKKKILILSLLTVFILLYVGIIAFNNTYDYSKHTRFVNQLTNALEDVQSIERYEASHSNDNVKNIKERAAKDYIVNNLYKPMGISKVCTSENMKQCGFSFNSPIKTLSQKEETIILPTSLAGFAWNNSSYGASNDPHNTLTDTNVAGFQTKSGVSVAVYYNPSCGANVLDYPRQNGSWGWRYTANKMCLNFVYDLNGTKKPNTVGKDIGFVTAFYRDNLRIVSPKPYNQTANYDGNEKLTFDDAVKACTLTGGNYQLPNIEEAMSLYINKTLIDNGIGGAYWSSTPYIGDSGVMWRQDLSDGTSGQGSRNHKRYARCVRK